MTKGICNIHTYIRDALHKIFTIKGITIIFTIAFFSRYELEDIVKYANTYGVKIEGILLPFLHQNLFYSMIFALIIIYYYSDCPYLDKTTFQSLLRMGRLRWLLGKFAEITVGAVLLMLLETIISLLMLLPHVRITGEWGEVWNSLSIARLHDFPVFPRNIILLYNPFSAFFRVFGMGILVVTVMGSLQFIFSILCNKKFAMILNGIIAVGPILAANSGLPQVYFLSPASWIGIIEHSLVYEYRGPDMIYMVVTLFIIIMIVIILSWLIFKNKNLYDV